MAKVNAVSMNIARTAPTIDTNGGTVGITSRPATVASNAGTSRATIGTRRVGTWSSRAPCADAIGFRSFAIAATPKTTATTARASQTATEPAESSTTPKVVPYGSQRDLRAGRAPVGRACPAPPRSYSLSVSQAEG